jgi:hypothetical protein
VLTYRSETGEVAWEGKTIRPSDPVP